MAVFQERNGRFSPEKTFALAAVLAPLVWLGWRIWISDFSARPITEVLHFTGLWAVRFLLLSLTVTPLRRLFHWPKLMLARRTLGLAALGYASLHLLLYAADQKWNPERIASEIALRFYLTIGAVALVALMVLGATSFDRAIRALGAKRWIALHTCVYGIAILAILHFLIQSKLDATEAILTGGLMGLVLTYRLVFWKFRRLDPAGLAALSLVIGVATGLGEMGWYAATTGLDPWRVVAANFDMSGGLSPAWWVAGTGVAVALAAHLKQRVAPPPSKSPARSRVKPALSSCPADGS